MISRCWPRAGEVEGGEDLIDEDGADDMREEIWGILLRGVREREWGRMCLHSDGFVL